MTTSDVVDKNIFYAKLINMKQKDIIIGIILIGLIAGFIGYNVYKKGGGREEFANEYDQLLININPGQKDDGDIVVIEDKNHEWGRMEKIKFLIARIPQLTDAEKTEFLSVDEKGEKLYKIDYSKFLTADEMARLARKETAFSLSRQDGTANVFRAITGEQYPIINKKDIVKK